MLLSGFTKLLIDSVDAMLNRLYRAVPSVICGPTSRNSSIQESHTAFSIVAFPVFFNSPSAAGD